VYSLRMNPIVQSIYHAATFTWTHVVFDAVTLRAAVIDPVLDFNAASGGVGSASARAIVAFVRERNLSVDWILETHAHADHLTASAWLKKTLSALGHSARTAVSEDIVLVQRTFKRLLDLSDDDVAEGQPFDHLLKDGDQLELGALRIDVLATPGHTPDGVSFLVGDAVFIGDTLFAPRGGSARCDFPGADAATLYRSIQRLYALPDTTRVFLAHDYPPCGEAPLAETTILDQKRSNIHLRADTSEQDYVTLRTQRDATLSVPQLLWPALQVNIRGGEMPTASASGTAFLKIPLTLEDFESAPE
jgi:glyoxylase-like metal-dependent hydrolase (beta-lactamase superfamily II)